MKTKALTALFIGLGSIGSRHLQNLTTLCVQQGVLLRADALRSDITRPLREGVAEKITLQFVDFAQGDVTCAAQPQEGTQAQRAQATALQPLDYYDLVFITNPTSLHAQVLQQVQGKAGALFIEKPIFDATQIEIALDTLVPNEQKAYVAAPMRWSATMLALKEYLAQHPDAAPYSARAICSSYLPDWRPGVDYRTVYSAHRALGGGVTIDLIHEWDYLVDLFGKPLEMHNFKGTYSQLEIDSDDISIYIARYPNLLCELHLDYFGRNYRRALELFTREGTIIADFGKGTLTLPDGTVQDYAEETNAWYLREMQYFMDYAAEGGATHSKNPPQEALDVLRLTLGK